MTWMADYFDSRINLNLMDRRTAVSRLGLLLGGTLSATTVSALLAGCSTPPAENWSPKHFSPSQINLLRRIAEVIIPETDSPGAAASGVHRFIDTMMAEYYSPEEAHLFRSMLDAWDMSADLSSSSDEVLHSMVSRADQRAFNGGEAGQDEHYRLLKQLVVVGYYTSEIGMTQELRLRPYGAAKMDIARSEVQRTWAD